jgi:hypothetical protein
MQVDIHFGDTDCPPSQKPIRLTQHILKILPRSILLDSEQHGVGVINSRWLGHRRSAQRLCSDCDRCSEDGKISPVYRETARCRRMEREEAVAGLKVGSCSMLGNAMRNRSAGRSGSGSTVGGCAHLVVIAIVTRSLMPLSVDDD